MIQAIEEKVGVYRVEYVEQNEDQSNNPQEDLQEIVLLPDAVPPLHQAQVDSSVKYGWVRGFLPAPHPADIYLVRFHFEDQNDPSKFNFQLVAYVDRFARAFFTKTPLIAPPARYPNLALAQQNVDESRENQNSLLEQYDTRGVVQLYQENGTTNVVADYLCHDNRYVLFNNWFTFKRYENDMSLDETMARAYFAFVYRPYIMRMPVPSRGFEHVDNLLEGSDVVQSLNQVASYIENAQEDDAQQPPAPIICLQKFIEECGVAQAWEAARANGNRSGVLLAEPSAYSEQFRLFRNPNSPISTKTVWRLESVLNRYALLRTVLGPKATTATMAQCAIIDEQLFCHFPTQLGETIFAHKGALNEWSMRSSIGRALEEVRVPMRFEATFRADLESGTVAFEIMVPTADMLPRAVWNHLLNQWDLREDDERELNALTYAQRIGIMLAGIAAKQHHKVQTVCVTAEWFNENLADETGALAYSVIIDCETLRAPNFYENAVQDPGSFFAQFVPLDNAWETSDLPNKRWVQQNPFWMVSAAPTYSDHFKLADLEEKCYQEGSAYALGCGSSLGLAINYNANNRNTAENVAEHLHTMDTVSQGIEYLQEKLNSSSNPDTVQACTRLMTQLTQGTVDLRDKNHIVSSFLGDNDFERVLRELSQAVGENQGVEQAIAAVESLVNETLLAGAFADDDHTVYRVFDSSTSRVIYNLARNGRLPIKGLAEIATNDRSKTIELAPDGYFHCCLELTSIYASTFQRTDDAIRYGKECVRLAPTVPSGYRHLARAYMLSGEAELAHTALISALGFATGAKEIAALYYQLAYAEWKAGRTRSAQACYLHAIADNPELALIAASELITEINLGIMLANEIEPELKNAGIPLAPNTIILDALQDAGRAAVNEGAFLAARNLLSVQLHHRPDDALYHVLRSLER